MKKIIKASGILASLVIFFSVHSYAQFEEDVLRLSTPGLGVGARALGMGMAFTGVANDFSASYWNPAGLGQLHMNEVTLGLSHVSYGNTGTLSAGETQLGNSQSFTNSGTNLNSLGLVYAVPAERGNLVIALGYGRSADFTTGLSFSGFNPLSSIIQARMDQGGLGAPDGQDYPSDFTIAEQLEVAFADTNTGKFISPIHDSLTQSGKVLEGGGLNNISGSLAFEAAPDLFLGATLSVITGSYSYRRDYSEEDLHNVYGTFPFDFSSLSLFETVESDISGVTAKIGTLYKFGPNSRVGVAIKLPSWINVREDFSTEAQSTFDNGDVRPKDGPYTSSGSDEFDVTTPFVFSAGISYGIQRLMLAGDIDYTDWTEMEFRNANDRLLKFNTQIKEDFQPTANIRLGAEYEAVEGLLQVRGGFDYLPSPYQGDPSSFARKYVTAGIGFIADNAFAIDLAYAHGYWETTRINYDYTIKGKQTSRTNEDISTNDLIGTVSFRF